MQIGEVLRRVVFNGLDAAKGGKLKKLKEVNKREIVEGVTEDYRREEFRRFWNTQNVILLIIERIPSGKPYRIFQC